MDKNGKMLLQAEYQSLMAQDDGLYAAKNGDGILLFRLEQGSMELLLQIEIVTVKEVSQ